MCVFIWNIGDREDIRVHLHYDFQWLWLVRMWEGAKQNARSNPDRQYMAILAEPY